MCIKNKFFLVETSPFLIEFEAFKESDSLYQAALSGKGRFHFIYFIWSQKSRVGFRDLEGLRLGMVRNQI